MRKRKKNKNLLIIVGVCMAVAAVSLVSVTYIGSWGSLQAFHMMRINSDKNLVSSMPTHLSCSVSGTGMQLTVHAHLIPSMQGQTIYWSNNSNYAALTPSRSITSASGEATTTHTMKFLPGAHVQDNVRATFMQSQRFPFNFFRRQTNLASSSCEVMISSSGNVSSPTPLLDRFVK